MVGSMIGSKTAPVRWKPPTKPASWSRPVRRRALPRTLTAPACEQADTTTSPLPATSTIRFWSSRISGSGSQPSPARALWMGKPTSNSVTRGTSPEISTWLSSSRVRPRSSTTSRSSASRSARLGGGRRSSAPVGKVILRSRQAPGWISSGSRRPVRPARPLEAAVVVDVAVGDDDGPQPGRVDLEHVEVVDQPVRGQAAVVQDRAAPPARLHGDQGREAVLGHQLVLIEVVVGQREPAHPVATGQQDVDEVVDHQGDLDGVDRLQLDHAG